MLAHLKIRYKTNTNANKYTNTKLLVPPSNTIEKLKQIQRKEPAWSYDWTALDCTSLIYLQALGDNMKYNSSIQDSSSFPEQVNMMERCLLISIQDTQCTSGFKVDVNALLSMLCTIFALYCTVIICTFLHSEYLHFFAMHSDYLHFSAMLYDYLH